MNRLKHALMAKIIGAACHGKAGLAIGTTTTAVQNANAVDYEIDGLIYNKGVSDPLDTPTGDEQSEDTRCFYLFSADSGGTMTCTQGDIVDAGDNAYYPELPSGNAPIGGILVETDSTTKFTPGTTDLNATGVTTTYHDLGHVPSAAY